MSEKDRDMMQRSAKVDVERIARIIHRQNYAGSYEALPEVHAECETKAREIIEALSPRSDAVELVRELRNYLEAISKETEIFFGEEQPTKGAALAHDALTKAEQWIKNRGE